MPEYRLPSNGERKRKSIQLPQTQIPLCPTCFLALFSRLLLIYLQGMEKNRIQQYSTVQTFYNNRIMIFHNSYYSIVVLQSAKRAEYHEWTMVQ